MERRPPATECREPDVINRLGESWAAMRQRRAAARAVGLRHDRYQVRREVEEQVSWAAVETPDPAYGYVNQPGLVPGAGGSRRWITIMAYYTQCSDAYTECRGCTVSRTPASGTAATLSVSLTPPAGRARRARPTPPPCSTPRCPRWRAGATATPVPTGRRPLPDRTLSLPGTLTVDVSRAFADPDGDPLTWAVSSSAPGVVAVTAAGPRVALTAGEQRHRDDRRDGDRPRRPERVAVVHGDGRRQTAVHG